MSCRLSRSGRAKRARAASSLRSGASRASSGHVSLNNIIEHVTPADGNIFEDLGFPQAEARRITTAPQLPSIEYGRRRPRIPKRLIRWMSIATSIVLAIAGIYLILQSRFSYISICTICGEVQSTTEWKLPFTDITYHASSSVRQTALSSVLAARFPQVAHQHNWLFVQGGGNGVLCALGEGRYLWEVAERPHTVGFVDAMLKYGDSAHQNALMSILRDPNKVQALDAEIGLTQFPDAGVATQAAYDLWWHQHGKEWDHDWATFHP